MGWKDQFTKPASASLRPGSCKVIFVAANTVFIAHYELTANLVTAFLISIIWTHNVKKIAFGDEGDRTGIRHGAAFRQRCRKPSLRAHLADTCRPIPQPGRAFLWPKGCCTTSIRTGRSCDGEQSRE